MSSSTGTSAGNSSTKAENGSEKSSIPKAPFVDLSKVDAEHIDDSLLKLNEALQKYKFMEDNIARRQQNLKDKINEYEITIEALQLLQKKRLSVAQQNQVEDDDTAAIDDNDDDDSDGMISDRLEVHFEVADTLYAKAQVDPGDKVSLWLGADVMVDFTHGEALSLLRDKLTEAKQSLQRCTNEAEFVREQITTMEVNISRVYNHGVMSRRQTVAAN